MFRREALPASVHASSGENAGGAFSLSQSHQLIGRQGQDTEHQVPHDLGAALDPEGVTAELILEPRIAALGDGAFVVADRVGRLERLLQAAARIVVDQRDMAEATAVLMQFEAAIGGIHDVVEIGDALRADQRQRNGGAAVVHRRGREQRCNRHTTVGGVQVQLVAIPADFVPLGIALGAAVARRGDVLEHLRQALLALALEGRHLGGCTDFAAPRAAAFLRQDRGRWRAGFFLGDQGRLGRRRRCRRRTLGVGRALARFDRGAVAADVADQFIPEVFLDERLMHPFGQTPLSKLVKRAREGGFGGQFPAQREATDAPQRTIHRQALDQPHRGRQSQHRLRHESVRQPSPLTGRTTHATPRRRREFLDAHPFQGVDDALQLRRQRAHLVLQLGQQFVLNHVPALQDQFALSSIHGAGVMMFGLVTASCQKWPPAPSAFASRRKKPPTQCAFCKRLPTKKDLTKRCCRTNFPLRYKFAAERGVSNTHQPLEIEMAKKKVFVSFDYENDKHYKFLLQAWDANPNFDFYFSDLSSQEINSLSIPVVKQKLSQKINEATYTLVIVGKEANKQHKDHKDIGYKNWLNYEIAKSKEHKNKLVGVKIDRTYDSPEQLLNSGASWAMSFTQDAIIKALNDAAS